MSAKVEVRLTGTTPADLLHRVLDAAETLGGHVTVSGDESDVLVVVDVTDLVLGVEPAPAPVEDPGEGGHVCGDCGRTFGSPGGLKTHRQRQHPSRTPVDGAHGCPECERRFTTEHGLRVHLARYHGRPGESRSVRRPAPVEPHEPDPATEVVAGPWTTEPIGRRPVNEARARAAAAEAL